MTKEQLEQYRLGLVQIINEAKVEVVTRHNHKLVTKYQPLTERNYKRIFAEIQRVTGEIKERSRPSFQPVCEAVVGRP